MTSENYAPSPSDFVREQVETYERTAGQEGNTMHGLPVVILTTIGARTGYTRKTPLMRVEHDGEYAVVASMGGAPKHPVWYHNIKSHPTVQLQDGPQAHDFRAREVSGAEKTSWWNRAVEAFPAFAEYQRKTEREIPVFVLQRI